MGKFKSLFLAILIALISVFSLTSCSEVDGNGNKRRINVEFTEFIQSTAPAKDNKSELTREQVATWLYRVEKFYNDEADGISEDSEKESAINLYRAIKSDVLQGDDKEKLDSKEKAKREEVFAMFCRVFVSEEELEENDAIITPYPDYSEISDWARASVARMASILSEQAPKEKIELFENGLEPKKNITQEEMIKLFDAMSNSKYNRYLHITLPEKIINGITSLARIYQVLWAAGIFALLAFIIKLIHKFIIKLRTKKEIIYMGCSSSGKTELSRILPDPEKIVEKGGHTPTRVVRKAKPIIKKEHNGYIYFNGVAKDTAGSNDEALIKLLHKKHFINSKKILILVLSHTKSDTDKKIRYSYINQQKNKIREVYLPAIRANKSQIEKLAVFVNKCDNLPDEYKTKCGNLKESLYKEIYNMLSNDNTLNDISFQWFEGSALQNNNISTLRDFL